MKQTFPGYKSANGWNALLPEACEPAILDGDLDCDVVIIGAGYTGLAVARRWAEIAPDDNIVVLEASRVGEGNPGRNSGFLLEISLANDANAAAIERMRDCNAAISGAMGDIAAIVREHKIPCDLERTGTYRAAAGKVGMQALDAYREFLDGADLPCEALDKADLAARLGTDFYCAGLYSPHCYLAQPAALIRGLASALPASVAVFEQSPAIANPVANRRNGSRWQVQTPRGNVTATSVVLANNAFAKALGTARSRVTAIYTYAGLTEQVSPDLRRLLGEDATWGLLPAHRLGSTLRKTRDGRLLIRSFYDYETEADPARVEQDLANALQRRFPDMTLPAFEHVWAGATGLTFNGAPVWGKAGEGLYISAGCNGGGVVKGTLFGSALADLAHGRPTIDVAGLFGSASWMPPDPIRRFGFNMIASVEGHRGSSEI